MNLSSLHDFGSKKGIQVYNVKNELMGVTTGYTAQAHNGKCIGEIEIVKDNETRWIRGYGVHVVGMGIKCNLLLYSWYHMPFYLMHILQKLCNMLVLVYVFFLILHEYVDVGL